MAKERGCGRRKTGAAYMETLVGGQGPSITTCLLDPPQVIDPVALGVSAVGVSLVEIEGVTHVIDWVGSAHYPNVADFAEEMFVMGVSRRISRREEFSRLTAESRLMLVHARAHVEFDPQAPAPPACPVIPSIHMTSEARQSCGCIGKVWQDVDGLDPDTLVEYPHSVQGRRVIGSTQYEAHKLKPEFKRTYQPAIFAVVPIHRIAVIKHPTDPGVHESTFDAASEAGVPVVLEDE